MKKVSYIHAALFASMATASLSLSPMLCAQTSTADQTQSTKTTDSVADKNSATTGNPNVQTPTLDKTNSKDTTTALDKNPSTAPTGSADKSATKDPNSVTSDKPMTASAPHRTTDKEFLVKAAEGGMTEVELGKLAQEKGSSADVKQFGSHMVMDHSKADAELKEIAAKKGVTVPSTLDAKNQATVDKLSALSGPAFDKAYVHTMVKDHEKTVADFRAESTSAQDPDVKNFASETLPTIETHLADIKSIQGKLK